MIAPWTLKYTFCFIGHQLISILMLVFYGLILLAFIGATGIKDDQGVLLEVVGVIGFIAFCCGVPFLLGRYRPDVIVGARWTFVLPMLCFVMWFVDYSFTFGVATALQYAQGKPESTEGLYLLFFTMPMLSSLTYSIGIELARRWEQRPKADGVKDLGS